MRALTHIDKFMCPHGCPIVVMPPAQPRLRINGQPVLLVDELLDAEVACAAGPVRCNRVQKVTNPADLHTQVGGKKPAMQGVLVTTDRGPAMALPAPGRRAWRLGAAPSFEAPAPALKPVAGNLDQESKGSESQGPRKPARLPAGVYVGRRKLGASASGQQFLLLVPEGGATLQEARDFGRDTKGVVIAGHAGTEPRGRLQVVRNEADDFAAAKEWIAAKSVEKSAWQSNLAAMSLPSGQTVDGFIKAILAAAERYEQSAKTATVEYPVTDLLLHLQAGRHFNGESWIRGVLHAAGAAADEPAGLVGRDLPLHGGIPRYYFLDNRRRKTATQQRRRHQIQGTDPAGRIKQASRCIVEQIVRDAAISSKEEMALEDLRAILLKGEPSCTESRLDARVFGQAPRLTLALGSAAGASASRGTAALVAGLFWGFYGEGLNRLSPDALIAIREGTGNPLAFLCASVVGQGLASGAIPLGELPQRLDDILQPDFA